MKHEALFLLLTTLRAANADSLFVLHFRALKMSRRTAMRRLRALVDGGYLGHVRLDHARYIYHLTAKAIALSLRLQRRSSSSTTTPPADRQGVYGWVRSALWAALVAAGWCVGCGIDSAIQLRRFVIDDLVARSANAPSHERSRLEHELKWARSAPALALPHVFACARCRWTGSTTKCPRCVVPTETKFLAEVFICRACRAPLPSTGGEHVDPKTRKPCACRDLREVDVLKFDVAWRRIENRRELCVLLVDDPSRSIEGQLRALPLVTMVQAPLPLIVRHTDPHSRVDRRTGRWVSTGRRKAELDKALAEKRVVLVDFRSDIQANFDG